MRQNLFTAVLTIMFATALLLIVSSCSQQNSLEPTGANDNLYAAAVVADDGAEPQEPTFVEPFDDHINTGTWSFFDDTRNPYEVFAPKDGNPGAYRHTWWCRSKGGLVGHVVRLRTGAGESSVFTGNFRERGVTKVGLDLSFPGDLVMQTDERPVCLMLSNDMGTPADTTDDLIALWLGSKGLPPDNGIWKEYTFVIDSESPTLPDGWMIFPGFGTGDDDADWNTIITDVSQVHYTLGDPRDKWIYDFQLWDVGLDNPRIWFTQ